MLHRDLPVRALGLGGRQGDDVYARIAQRSKFSTVAGFDRIIKAGKPALGPTLCQHLGPAGVNFT
jgi:hypothetical protein